MDAITYYKANQSDIPTLIDLRVEFLIDILGSQPSESIDLLKNGLEVYFLNALNKDCVFYLAKSGNINVGIGGMVIREQLKYIMI